jgi:hypothetical protein
MNHVSIELEIDSHKLEVGPNYDEGKWECRHWKDGAVERVYQHANQGEVIAAAFREIFNKAVDMVSITRVRM